MSCVLRCWGEKGHNMECNVNVVTWQTLKADYHWSMWRVNIVNVKRLIFICHLLFMIFVKFYHFIILKGQEHFFIENFILSVCLKLMGSPDKHFSVQVIFGELRQLYALRELQKWKKRHGSAGMNEGINGVCFGWGADRGRTAEWRKETVREYCQWQEDRSGITHRKTDTRNKPVHTDREEG